MPKATAEARQQNAHERALATVAAMEDTVVEESDESSDDQEELPLPQVETAPAVERSRKHWDQMGGEDFFTYLRSINPEEQRNITLKVSSVNQDGSTGGLLRNVTGGWDMVDENWLREQFGVGKYKVELKTPPKSGRRNDWTRVQIGSDDEIKAEAGKKGASKGQASAEDTNQAVDVVASAAEKGMGFLGKSYEKALEVRQNSSDPVAMAKALSEMGGKTDTAGLLAGVASIIVAVTPKPAPATEDKLTPLLMQMLQNQAADAERRAREAKEDGERRERIAREEAEARNKDREGFWAMMKQQSDSMNAFVLKQAEGKADSLTQMTGLLSNFIKVKNEIDDSLGGGPKGPWDLVGNALDGVMQHGPAIVAAMKGASPQQVEQIQRTQNPQEKQAEPQPFYDMVIRLAKYFQRDPDNYDGAYLVEMIEAEYSVVHVEMFNQPKEGILSAIAAFEPYGKAIMDHPQASATMSKVIDAIKFPDTMDDIFGGEPEPDDEKEPIILHGKARKINGRAKVERAG